MTHALLGKTGADDIARQIRKPFVVVGPYGRTAIHVKAAVAPGEHVFNDGIADLAFRLEHLEHLIAKQFLQIFGRRAGAFRECAASGKTTIGGYQVQVVK